MVLGNITARVSQRPEIPSLARAVFAPLQLPMASPSIVFLAAMLAMLFRPPGIGSIALDRIAFAVLIPVVLLRALILQRSLWVVGPVTWPLLGLLILALSGLLTQPYDPQNWSVFAAKWFVPFVLYHVAGLVFVDRPSLRKFEIFCWIVLSYLTVIALLFLFDLKSWIVPRFIVDEGLGIHSDRARGPFLQAVANGMALVVLALLALDSYRRRRLPRMLALGLALMVPLAIFATKTRAVWLAFAGSVLVLSIFSPSRRVRLTSLVVTVAAAIGGVAVLSVSAAGNSYSERLEESSPVKFRMSMYQAGWDMVTEKPMVGWPAADIQQELEKRISDFHQEEFYFHNTYLEIAVAYGVVGLGLYLWLVIALFRLGRRTASPQFLPEGPDFLDGGFRFLWPVLLGVYFLNACFVVMNYQFVNGLLFTLAGMLTAQNRLQVQEL